MPTMRQHINNVLRQSIDVPNPHCLVDENPEITTGFYDDINGINQLPALVFYQKDMIDTIIQWRVPLKNQPVFG